MPKSVPPMSKEDRKRGRPAGKNRVPLSLEERRARNAQYERERRNETAEAMAELAEAAGYDTQISNKELLANVYIRFEKASKEQKDLDDYRRINGKLEEQIAILMSRLGDDVNIEELGLDDESEAEEQPIVTKANPRPEITKPRKARKYTKKSTVHDTHSDSQSSDSDWLEEERKRKEKRIVHKKIHQSESPSTEEQQTESVPSSIERTESESSNTESVQTAPVDNLVDDLDDIIQAVVDEAQLNEIITQELESLNQSQVPLDNLSEIDIGLLSDWLNSTQGETELPLNQEQTTVWPAEFNEFLTSN